MNDKVANVSVFSSWFVWGASHIAQINQFLQAIVFLAALTVSIVTAVYYVKKIRRLGRDDD